MGCGKSVKSFLGVQACCWLDYMALPRQGTQFATVKVKQATVCLFLFAHSRKISSE